MPAKLYVVHSSHPCATVQRALEMKAVPYRVVELLPPMHAALQRLRFGVRTVPGLTLESGEKLSGSRAIIRRLEELAPEPPLLPADPEERAAVERAEEWGDEVWQPMARRLLWRTFTMHPQAMKGYQAGSRFPLPGPAVRALAPLVSAVERQLNGAEEGAVRADLRSLPGHLDRIDGWLREGVLGGETVNAADLQIAPTSRLMLTIGDVRPYFAGRPAEAHAMALFGEWAGETPAGVFPAQWLSALRTPA
ncbi:MAG: glutathione S-transferase family protein [Solirubrobacteraceae bacterium]